MTVSSWGENTVVRDWQTADIVIVCLGGVRQGLGYCEVESGIMMHGWINEKN